MNKYDGKGPGQDEAHGLICNCSLKSICTLSSLKQKNVTFGLFTFCLREFYILFLL